MDRAPKDSLRRAAAAGLAGTVAATVATALLHTLWPAVPFPPVAIAQELVRAPSGAVDSFFIDRLGHWAQRLAVLGTSLAFAGSGALLGIARARLRRRASATPMLAATVALLPLWLASVVLYPSTPQHLDRLLFAAVTLPVWVGAGWFAARVLVYLTDEGSVRPNATRRVVVRAIGFGGAGVLVGLANLGRLLYRRPDPGQERFAGAFERARKPRPSTDDTAFEEVPGLTKEVTSNAAHYVVDEEIIDPDIDPETWRLAVTGLVASPLSLTYDELLSYPLVERFHTLECISNEIGGHLIGTARWIGVPLHHILDDAGVRPGAVEVVFRAGGYSDSHSVEVAMDDSTLIAVGMNGRVLPRAHGFPARLLTLGTYGIKNPKWLTEIEVVDSPHEGFWQQRGWSKTAIVKTGARIDVPKDGATEGTTVTAGGIAFAGPRGISRVEVSTDGGSSWNEARLKTPLAEHTWRLWTYTWTASSADADRLVVRAYDGAGARQPATATDPYPSGASGYHSVDL